MAGREHEEHLMSSRWGGQRCVQRVTWFKVFSCLVEARVQNQETVEKRRQCLLDTALKRKK